MNKPGQRLLLACLWLSLAGCRMWNHPLHTTEVAAVLPPGTSAHDVITYMTERGYSCRIRRDSTLVLQDRDPHDSSKHLKLDGVDYVACHRRSTSSLGLVIGFQTLSFLLDDADNITTVVERWEFTGI